MKSREDPLISKGVDEIERFILSEVLEWKLSFVTPAYFLEFFVQNATAANGSGFSVSRIRTVLETAATLTELIFLSKTFPLGNGHRSRKIDLPTVSCKNLYVIAVAAGVVAACALDEEKLSESLKEWILPEFSVRFSFVSFHNSKTRKNRKR